MVTDDFSEAVYQRLLHNIASEGWQTNREVVGLSPPQSPPRAHFYSASPSGVTFPHRGLRSERAATQSWYFSTWKVALSFPPRML